MYTLPELPYAYNALEPAIDEMTMKVHHDKHHAAYVKNVNDALAGHDDLLSLPIEQLLQSLDKVPADIRMKVRNNGGGHANHSLFWTLMAPQSRGGGGAPKGKVGELIASSFGTYEAFQEKFAAAALGRFGSGWVWLTMEHGKLVISDTPNQDTPLMEGKTPLLGLDVWEHAYYLKYQNLRADYVKNWWNVVSWSEVEKRLGK
jgi:Fe-Mn family superoxide dismutase